MADIFGIINFVALCVIVGIVYHFREHFINRTSEESIATSVLSAIVSLATMEELEEHRQMIIGGIQPLFAEAMTGVVEQFQSVMAENLPSEEEIKQVTEQLTQETPIQAPTQEIQSVLQSDNPLMQLISSYLLKQLAGEPTKSPSATTTKGGW